MNKYINYICRIIQGLIEKSICNSADVREDDMLTEICKQEQQKLDLIELKPGSTPMTAILRNSDGCGSGFKPTFGVTDS